MKKKVTKNIVVLEGPSGVGKDSIIAELMKRHPGKYEKITSVTTREIRPGEIDGVNYKYVNRDQFEEMLRTNEIFEFTQRHGTYRGMSKPIIDKILEAGKIAIKDADIVGVRALKKLYPGQVLTIFVTAPKAEIERRLNARGDNKEDLIRRLKDYDACIKSKILFDHIVENTGALDGTVYKVHLLMSGNI